MLLGLRLIQDAQTLETTKAQANRLRHIATQTADNLGCLIRGLQITLEEPGLVVALTRYAADYTQSSGLTLNVHTSGLDAGRLPFPVEIALYRIVQEALTNIAKHAAANVVSIVLERQPSKVQANIADDGCGFDIETTLRTTTISNRLDLYGMYERATLLGGSIAVESKPGKEPRSPCKSHLKVGNHAPEMDHNVHMPVSESPQSSGRKPDYLNVVGGWGIPSAHPLEKSSGQVSR